jgi:hypothetical protein
MITVMTVKKFFLTICQGFIYRQLHIHVVSLWIERSLPGGRFFCVYAASAAWAAGVLK